MIEDRTQPYLGLFMESTGELIVTFETRAEAQAWVRGRHEILAREGDVTLRSVSAPWSIETWLDGPPMDRSTG